MECEKCGVEYENWHKRNNMTICKSCWKELIKDSLNNELFYVLAQIEYIKHNRSRKIQHTLTREELRKINIKKEVEK